MIKAGAVHSDRLAANWEYDAELGVWFVSISIVVADEHGDAKASKIIEGSLREIEALLPTVG